MRNSSKSSSAKTQREREREREKFEDAAREVETNDREKAFDAIVNEIAKASPPKDDKPPKKAAG